MHSFTFRTRGTLIHSHHYKLDIGNDGLFLHPYVHGIEFHEDKNLINEISAKPFDLKIKQMFVRIVNLPNIERDGNKACLFSVRLESEFKEEIFRDAEERKKQCCHQDRKVYREIGCFKLKMEPGLQEITEIPEATKDGIPMGRYNKYMNHEVKPSLVFCPEDPNDFWPEMYITVIYNFVQRE